MKEFEKKIVDDFWGRNDVSRDRKKEKIIKEFSVNIEKNPQYLIEEFKTCYVTKDAVGVERALLLMSIFDLDSNTLYLEEFLPIISKIAKEPWHYKHEDIAFALEMIHSPRTIDMVYDLAIMELDYMEYDEFFNIARKCTYALGNINTPKAKEKLELLAKNENDLIREYAKKQLNRHDFSDKDVEEEQY